MPTFARISCLTPILIFIFLTICTSCGNNDAEIEFYLNTDENTVAANHLLSRANELCIKDIEYETNRKPYYKSMLFIAVQTSKIVEEFNGYIEKTRNEVYREAGGLFPFDDPDKTKAGRPVESKNRKIACRFFLSGKQSKGLEIKNKILDTRRQLISLIDTITKIVPSDLAFIRPKEIEALKESINLKINDTIWKAYQSSNWEEFTFYQIPGAKVFPILSALQSEALKSEFKIVNFISEKMTNYVNWFDTYEPVSSLEAGYVILGERFKTDIFLASSGEIMGDSIAIKVNGSLIPMKKGKGHFEVFTKKIGENVYRVEIKVLNTITGRSETYRTTFQYYVGRRSQ